MSDYKLSPDKPIDVAEILKDLETTVPAAGAGRGANPLKPAYGTLCLP